MTQSSYSPRQSAGGKGRLVVPGRPSANIFRSMRTVLRVRGILLASVLASLTFVPRPSWSAWTSDPTVNLPVCPLAADQQWPKLATDFASSAIITWQDVRQRSSNNDIYAQHVTASCMVDSAWP